MEKFLNVIKSVVKALLLLVNTIAAPVVKVVRKAAAGQPINLAELGFALWRILIWMSFLLCMTGAVGVPSLIAMLFLADVVILAMQLVFAVSKTEVST